MNSNNYNNVCFVIMPFGKKIVNIFFEEVNEIKSKKIEIEIDFDYIYEEIFKPAIETVELPEGGKLISKRADSGFFSAIIDLEMFELIEYSRIALVDITGLNPNVFYELGVRHHARESGTLIFNLSRLPHSSIPFDIKRVRTFPYEYDPTDRVVESKEKIIKVLTESLQFNKVDSPLQLTLGIQKNNQNIQAQLVEAENALRNNDKEKALSKFYETLKVDEHNILTLMKIGLLHKDKGEWKKAFENFELATIKDPTFAEAYKEKGISQNKLHNENPALYIETGEKDLLKAIDLKNNDFDSYCSLGGIYKRLGQLQDSRNAYLKAMELSGGNHYPLLNYIKINASINGRFSVDLKEKLFLKRARATLSAQINDSPPYNKPWSFFDLAETILFLDNKEESEFLKIIEDGVTHCNQKWEIETFLNSLYLIHGLKDEPKGLQPGIEYLQEIITYF